MATGSGGDQGAGGASYVHAALPSAFRVLHCVCVSCALIENEINTSSFRRILALAPPWRGARGRSHKRIAIMIGSRLGNLG